MAEGIRIFRRNDIEREIAAKGVFPETTHSQVEVYESDLLSKDAAVLGKTHLIVWVWLGFPSLANVCSLCREVTRLLERRRTWFRRPFTWNKWGLTLGVVKLDPSLSEPRIVRCSIATGAGARFLQLSDEQLLVNTPIEGVWMRWYRNPTQPGCPIWEWSERNAEAPS